MKTVIKNATSAHSNLKGSALSDPIGMANHLRGYIHPSDYSITAGKTWLELDLVS